MKRFSGDPAFKFFYGIAVVLEGRIQEGIRELDPLQNYSEVKILRYQIRKTSPFSSAVSFASSKKSKY